MSVTRRVNNEHHHRYINNQARVYVCSGRAGGSERHLLFYARYVETWPHTHPQPDMLHKASNLQTVTSLAKTGHQKQASPYGMRYP